MAQEELQVLGEIIRLRLAQEAGTVTNEENTKLQKAEAQLASTGVDVDWLLDQRWVVANRREKAATQANPTVAGASVQLSGYAIPAPDADDGTTVFYLVPERGMCSHMPPPNPNQMIRVSSKSDWRPRFMHEPVRLSGELSIAPSRQSMIVVDGFVDMRATFAMQVTEVEALMTETDHARQLLAPWAQNVAAKARLHDTATSSN